METTNSIKKVKVDCYNCGNKESDYYDSENGWQYVKCIKCGLIYLNPRPSDEAITQASLTGEHKHISFTGRHKPSKVKKYKKILGDFYDRKELKEMSWLDIGCGFGELLMVLGDFGIFAKGSEPNQTKREFCKKKNLDVDFIDLQNHGEKYDCISLLNVYSHLPNPVDFLRELKKLLNPNGELFIQTGHSAFLPAKLHHKPYFAPDHLSFGSKEILQNILKKSGFEILEVKFYRMEIFPKIKEPLQFSKEIAKIFLKKSSWTNIFPKYPKRDMFIRAKLK